MIDSLKVLGTKIRCRQRSTKPDAASLRNRSRELCANGFFLPEGAERVYFHHIPKVAGCSIITSFLSAVKKEPAFETLVESRFGTIVHGERPFVYFDHYLLEQGDYYFGSSHFPSHFLSLPPATFEFTCLRDPLERVVSLYKMVQGIEQSSSQPKGLRRSLSAYTSWLGAPPGSVGSFLSFVQRMPERFRLNQLYMFSRSLILEEAVERSGRLGAVLFQDRLDVDMEKLGRALEMNLKTPWMNRTATDAAVSVSELEEVRKMLAPEYAFVERVRANVTW